MAARKSSTIIPARWNLRTRLDLRQGMIIREYLCRRCSVLRHLSQKQKTASCKRLSAAKLRLKLGGWPDILDTPQNLSTHS